MDISKKLLEDIRKVREKGIVKDTNSLDERFKKKEPPKKQSLTESYGAYEPYVADGKVFKAITFHNSDEAEAFLKANPDHVIKHAGDGAIKVVHSRDQGTPTNGVVSHDVDYEDVSPIVGELLLFVEHSPEFHSLTDNMDVHRKTPDVPVFPLHLKALVEEDRSRSIAMHFAQIVAEEYERRFGEKVGMCYLREFIDALLEDGKLADNDWTNQYRNVDQHRINRASLYLSQRGMRKGAKYSELGTSYGSEDLGPLGKRRRISLIVKDNGGNEHMIGTKPSIERSGAYNKALGQRVRKYRSQQKALLDRLKFDQ